MAIIRHIPSSNLYVSRPNWWLESRFHFSFAEYYNPNRNDFGSLRVVNDDLVQPNSGFGTHPHRDMEIFTYVVDGNLTHKDSMGTFETLGRGSVQYMSAGTGVTHSEMNKGNQILRFLQIWIKPDRKGHSPNYGSRIFKKEDRHNKLQHVLTSYENYENAKDNGIGVIPIHQDANIYLSEADASLQQEFLLQKKRQAYIVCIEGSLLVNQVLMQARDAVEIEGEQNRGVEVQLKAHEQLGAHFIVIEMALRPSS